jgi:hypothetical protein
MTNRSQSLVGRKKPGRVRRARCTAHHTEKLPTSNIRPDMTIDARNSERSSWTNLRDSGRSIHDMRSDAGAGMIRHYDLQRPAVRRGTLRHHDSDRVAMSQPGRD